MLTQNYYHNHTVLPALLVSALLNGSAFILLPLLTTYSADTTPGIKRNISQPVTVFHTEKTFFPAQPLKNHHPAAQARPVTSRDAVSSVSRTLKPRTFVRRLPVRLPQEQTPGLVWSPQAPGLLAPVWPGGPVEGLNNRLPGGRLYAAGELDTLPRFKFNPQPAYPLVAERLGIEGYVKLEFTVMPDGTVDHVSVIESSPEKIFNRSAVQAVSRYRFYPGILNGRPVQTKTGLTIRYTLDN